MLDEQILQLFITRNEDAIQETNIKYGSYCNTISYNILNNKEDANETWYRTWNAIPPAYPKYLKLFLAKITRNISINKLKSKHKKIFF